MWKDSGTKRQNIQRESASDDSDDSGRILPAQHRKRLRRNTIVPKTSDNHSVGCGDSDDVKSGGGDIDLRDRRMPEKRFLVLTAAGTACDPELIPSPETSSDVRDEVLDREDQGQSTSTPSEQQVDEDSMAHSSDQRIAEGEELESSLEDFKESSGSEDEDNSGSLPLEPEEASDSNFDLESESEAASTDTSESKLLTQASRRKIFRKRGSVPQIKRRSRSAEDHYHKRWHSGKPSREAQQNIVEKLRYVFFSFAATSDGG
ncbi:hypothetical protein TRV_00120 [Trichophyton verrucosum HKI 0517]|uniref:Uncharacterized protein n=1 Tax=Trichophyton verrucosum (strain HKI 0517) TaxID=663202 RepID=D4CZ83_TRIVH|nr:uncharacterized protein TRV_00120 [Trichophyton verrucosum HKI 0517]EFE45095.1 hypothetical protein TRV_00120 [Trichophyton verrucosum HKI 0517]